MPDGIPDKAGPLLETRALARHFRIGGVFGRAKLHAVDDLDPSTASR